MKKLLALFLVLSAISTSSQAAVILSVTPDNNSVDTGEDVVLNISATTTEGSVFTSFGLDLLMNNTQLLASDMSVMINSLFDTFPTPDGDGFAGGVPPMVTPMPPFAPLPFAISGTDINLATITISNLSDGFYDFNLGVTAMDMLEGVINADFLSAPPGNLVIDDASFAITSITVGPVEQVNAPALGLFMSFALGLMLMRRKS
jgi:hypothetical protein